MHEPGTVQLRYAGLPFAGVEVPGLCFEFSSRQDAQSFFGHVHNYLRAPAAQKSLQLQVDSVEKAGWNLKLQIQEPSGLLVIDILDVRDEIISRLLNHLQTVSYYIVLAGYTVGENVELLSPKAHHLLKHDLWVNGRQTFGTATKELRWDELVNQLPETQGMREH